MLLQTGQSANPDSANRTTTKQSLATSPKVPSRVIQQFPVIGRSIMMSCHSTPALTQYLAP
ncbi:MAG: hypothetical protein WCL60_13140 [Methylococcales bacterium]